MLTGRLGWLAVLTGAVVVAIGTGLVAVREFSMGCSKFGTVEGLDLVHADATCDSSTFYALGAWPSVQVGLILGAPAVVAAAAAHRWVSALATVVYVGIAVYGVGHWSGWLIVLLPAGVMFAVVAAILAVGDLNRHDRARRGEAEHA